jgi:hypothetical protein
VPTRCVVDASVHYDPASRRWLATTLRCVCLDGRPLADDEPPPPAPAGLPALDSRPIFLVTIELERRELDAMAVPELDADARALLGLEKQ